MEPLLEKAYVVWEDDILLMNDGSVLAVRHVTLDEIVLVNGAEARAFDRKTWQELRPLIRYAVREDRWFEV